MTRYTVVWHANARGDPARLWIDSPDRKALTRAAHRIDSELVEDPEHKGSEVSEGLRQLIVDPLRVFFVVREPDRTVDVDRVLPT